MNVVSSPSSESLLTFQDAKEHPRLRQEYLRKLPLKRLGQYLHWIRYVAVPIAVQQVASHLFGYRNRASTVLAGPRLFQTDDAGDVLSELRDYAGMKGKQTFLRPDLYADLLIRLPCTQTEHLKAHSEYSARVFQRRRFDRIEGGVSDS
jgi:hypothetical protein